MISFLKKITLDNWPRKGIALLLAIIIWHIVNQSISIEVTIPNIAIKVINLPSDKTIHGILPDGTLSQKISVTLSGIKSTVEHITPDDLQVVFDAQHEDKQWIARVNKQTLVSLNSNLNLHHHIKNIVATDIPLVMSNLITDVVPIDIVVLSSPLRDYQFLDIWPRQLSQTVTGPQEQILEWKKKHFTLTIDLKNISKEELDALQGMNAADSPDEIGFLVPRHWKHISVPFLPHAQQEINDPEAKELRIYFLKKKLLPLERPLNLFLFYPVKESDTLNPSTYPIKLGDSITKQNGIPVLTLPLFAGNVSPLFLDIVKDFLVLSVSVLPHHHEITIPWSKQLMNSTYLEERYVEAENQNKEETVLNEILQQEREKMWRQRFRNYFDELAFFLEDGSPLQLRVSLQEDGIHIEHNGPSSSPAEENTQ